MKHRPLYIAVTLMIFALSGLLYMQYHWISDSMRMQGERFDQSVRQALNNAVYNLERKEMTRRIHGSPLMIDISIDERSSYKPATIDTFLIANPNNGEPTKSNTNPQEANFMSHRHPSQEKMGSKGTQYYINELMNIVSSMGNTPFHDKIDEELLKTTLDQSLENSGIKSDYNYCVYSPFGDELYAQPCYFDHKVMESSYTTLLFPDDIHNGPGQLFIHFPGRNEYILSNSMAMLASSLLFNLIIMLTFAYTVNTILRQKKLSEMKTDFINNMTHELKTPISTINLACEMLADPDVSKDQANTKRFSGIIYDENKRLENHVEKVLQYARLEKGELKMNKVDLDLHHILENVVEKTSLQVEKLNGQLTVSFNAKDSSIEGDAMHLTDVIYNLIDNAIKYRRDTPIIHIETQSDNNGISVSVQDNGIGMSKDTIKHIFEKFYRVPTGDIHNVKGFGLGLSYVKSIIDAHQGKIEAKSKPDKGTTISFFLPFQNNHNNPK